MTDSFLEPEELCFIKGLKILSVAAEELRQLFEKEWNKKHSGETWTDNEHFGLKLFNEYRPKNIRLEDTRYDNAIKTGNRSKWDITILCRIFLKYTLVVRDDRKITYLDQLRKMRNAYSHPSSIKRDVNEYNKDLGRARKWFEELKLDIEKLNKVADLCVSDVAKQALLVLVKELKEDILDKSNLLSAQAETILENNEECFVETEACKEAAGILDREGILYLCGAPNSGKSAIGKHLLSRYAQQEDRFQPFILESIADIKSVIDPTKKQALMVSNIFGTYAFRKDKVDDFKYGFDHLWQFADESKKFIFTSSNTIFPPGLPFLRMNSIFSDSQVIDLTKSGSLSSSEKKNMLSRYLKKHDSSVPDSLIDKIAACKATPIFPACCKLFARTPELHDQAKAVAFFEEPISYHINFINCSYKIGNPAGYAALVLTMVFEGLPNSIFIKNSLLNEQAKEHIDAICGDDDPSFASIKLSADSLLETYLVRRGDGYDFSESYMYDAVACTVGQTNMEFGLKNCSVEFLHRRVCTQEEHDGKDKPCLVLKPEHYEVLSKRFIGDIRNGNLSSVVTHNAFSTEKFVSTFTQMCTNEKGLKKAVFTSEDKSQPFLYWSAWNRNKDYLLKWIIHDMHKQENDIPQDMVKKIAKSCCISGNLPVLELLFNVLPSSFSKTVDDITRTQIQIPMFAARGSEIPCQLEETVQVSRMLHAACFHGHLPIVQFISSRYDQFSGEVNVTDADGHTPLNLAARQGHTDIVQFLIDNGASIRLVNRYRNTAFADACESGQTEVAELLLEMEHKLLLVRGPEPLLRYPIHLAALSGRAKLVQLLLKIKVEKLKDEKNAGPGVEDAHKNTAFHLACTKARNESVLEALCPTPDQLNRENKEGNTCLHLGSRCAGLAMVQLMIDKGSNVNARNKIHQTPLHKASKTNSRVVVEFLLSHEADACALDIKGRSPFSLTTSKTIATILKDRMAILSTSSS